MKQKAIIELISALNENNIRYMIAGGLAVVFHGYVRFTSDVDLILDLDNDNMGRAILVFEKLGYVPRLPVKFSELSDPKIRKRWIEEKGMMVFSLFHTINVETPIDIFVKIPFDFDLEYKKSIKGEIIHGVNAIFINYELLLNLKRISNREIDKIDILNLENIRKI